MPLSQTHCRICKKEIPAGTQYKTLCSEECKDLFVLRYTGEIDTGICPCCHKVFHLKRRDQTFCSKHCRDKDFRLKHIKLPEVL